MINKGLGAASHDRFPARNKDFSTPLIGAFVNAETTIKSLGFHFSDFERVTKGIGVAGNLLNQSSGNGLRQDCAIGMPMARLETKNAAESLDAERVGL